MDFGSVGYDSHGVNYVGLVREYEKMPEGFVKNDDRGLEKNWRSHFLSSSYYQYRELKNVENMS
ncbi:hypothetical protein GCM10028868_32220 [Virgibacillus kimchii]